VYIFELICFVVVEVIMVDNGRSLKIISTLPVVTEEIFGERIISTLEIKA